MKTNQKKQKMKLEKFKVAKINNLKVVKGGGDIGNKCDDNSSAIKTIVL